jgi:hypothetical protein
MTHINSSDIFQLRGWWWNTMGFTKIHLVGVFFTEFLLGTIGTGIAIAAVAGLFHNTVAWLLVAVCVFLVQLSVLLSSILSLLFYIGSRVERATDQEIDGSDYAD